MGEVSKVVPTQMPLSLPFPWPESLLRRAEGTNLVRRAVHQYHLESPLARGEGSLARGEGPLARGEGPLARGAGTKCQVLW